MKLRAPRLRRVTRRLGFRLALLLSIALLPLGLIAVLQTMSAVREADARSRAALLGETLLVVETQLRTIQRARGLAEALAIALQSLVVDDNDRCRSLLRTFAAEDANYSLVALVPLNGQVSCSSTDRPLDLSEDPVYQRLLASDEPAFAVHPLAPVLRRPVVTVSHPVRGEDGEIEGVVSVNVPHSILYREEGEDAPALSLGLSRKNAALVTFNRQGEVLTATGGAVAAAELLPRDRSLAAFVGTPPVAFGALSQSGRDRVYSIVPLIDGELYALGTWPADIYRVGVMGAAPSVLFPTLMWIASLLVAWLGAAHMVTTPIWKLRRAITAFAAGDHRVNMRNLRHAPLEIWQLSRAFEQMTQTIIYDKAELENAVHQKEVLLREVHHRVKNNLQLIASIMNMQMRQTRSDEAKWLMHGLRDRVMSLATIHRGLYQTTGLTDIRADELLSDILRQVVKMGTGPGRRFAVKSSFAPIRLTPDQAVPLALLLTEALTNALKYAASADGGPASLRVTLEDVAPMRARLSVANSTGGTAPTRSGDEAGTGLGSQLLEAFAHQIGGAFRRRPGRGGRVLSFRVL
jgi:two-component system, sensor histidine kinase PdtaS